MSRPAVRVLLASLIASSLYAQQLQPNTNAELQLKQTLAKIVFAHEVHVIQRLSATEIRRGTIDVQQALAAEKLEFAVSNETSGSLSSISMRNLADLVSWLPDNRQLDVNLSSAQFSNEHGLVGEQAEAQVNWNGGGGGTAPVPPAMTLSDYLRRDQQYSASTARQQRYAGCERFINATIRATYKGESAEWRALYLVCGQNMAAIDFVMDEAVPRFWNTTVYPYAILGGYHGQVAGVQEWLNTHASASCSGTQTCFENGQVVIPKQNIPAALPALPAHGAIKPPSTSDGLSCPDYGFSNFHPSTPSTNDDHITGKHNWAGDVNISCSYSGVNGNEQGPCNVEAGVDASSVMQESGITRYWPFHTRGQIQKPGYTDAGPHVTATAQGVAAGQIDYCLFPCGTSISIKGYSVTFGSGSKFNQEIPGTAVCPPQTGGPGSSPLVVDPQNNGWHFVKPSVPFDMNVTGTPQVSAWPDATYGVAFLALPNHGQITSGLELFGNHTPQPACPGNWPHCQNGFRALAVYDDNHDGMIDKHDKIWPYLRLWIDYNMNGKVDGGELMTLNAAGITSISLKYQPTMTHVAWGTLRYESTLTGLPDKRIFDVFLSQSQ